MAVDPVAAHDLDSVKRALAQVCDPEIPVLSIVDLGILRSVRIEHGEVTVVITPTYSGCPAMATISDDIVRALHAAGYAQVVVETCLAPAWTSDWLSAAGRARLQAYGIAPPVHTTASKRALLGCEDGIRCPRCMSDTTERISEFGSTACKALYRCRSCLEPFDYFKCL